jgi:multidrug efflux pump subunit AcrA (membrane-fusion protein)
LELGVNCPEEPSVEVDVELLDGGVCRIGESAFTTSEPGEYKVSPDNQYLRISIPSTGYQRIVKTTGSITKVFWSEEDEAVTKTSSTYSIPAGIVYAEVKMGYGLPGEIVMSDGVLRFEKRVGLVGYKMVNCGRVEGRMVREEEG